MAKPNGLANQKLCYIQMPLDIEKSGEQEKEQCKEWLVYMGPGFLPYTARKKQLQPLPFDIEESNSLSCLIQIADDYTRVTQKVLSLSMKEAL